MLRKLLKLILCLAIPLAAGTAAGFYAKENITNWYSRLIKPVFSPPDYLFAPVWIVLYILMGISLFMIWSTPAESSKSKAYLIWGLQLILNFIWSFIFFNWKEIGMAAADISFLFISIVAMVLIFYPINKKAALLQVPYLAWVFFATILNLVIWELN